MNSTYSLEETEIDIIRPTIDNDLDLLEAYKKQNNLNNSTRRPESEKGMDKKLVNYSFESSKSNPSLKLVKNLNIPNIVICDWDETCLFNEIQTNRRRNSNNINKNLVMKMNIDQFHQNVSYKTNKNHKIKRANFKKCFFNPIMITQNIELSQSSLSSYQAIFKTANIQIESYDFFEKMNLNKLFNTKQNKTLNENNLDYKTKNVIKLLDENLSKSKSHIYENDEYNFNDMESVKKVTKRKDSVNKTLLNRNYFSKIEICPMCYAINHDRVEKFENLYSVNSQCLLNLNTCSEILDVNKRNNFKYEYYFLYLSYEKFKNIYNKRCIDLDQFIHNNIIFNGILFLTLPPETSNLTLLGQLDYSNNHVDIDSKRIACVIKLRRSILDKNKKCIIKLTEFKYVFTKRIVIGQKFPIYEIRSK